MGKYKYGRIKRDRDAVSPVIATILMVAVTVVIAATVYSYTSGTSSNKKSTPAVNLAVIEQPADDITLTHNGGEDLEWTDITILIDGTKTTPPGSPTGTFTVGEEELLKSDSVDGTSYRIKVIWNPTNAILLDKSIRV